MVTVGCNQAVQAQTAQTQAAHTHTHTKSVCTTFHSTHLSPFAPALQSHTCLTHTEQDILTKISNKTFETTE